MIRFFKFILTVILWWIAIVVSLQAIVVIGTVYPPIINLIILGSLSYYGYMLLFILKHEVWDCFFGVQV